MGFMLKHEVRLNDYWYVMRNLNYSKIQGKILVNYDMVNLDYLGNSFSNILNCRIINCKGLVYNQQQREEVLPISNKPRSKIRIERDLIKAKNAIRILGLNFNHSFHTTWCVRPRHFPLVNFTTLRNKFSLHLPLYCLVPMIPRGSTTNVLLTVLATCSPFCL